MIMIVTYGLKNYFIFSLFYRFTIRLQGDRYNHVLYMQPDSIIEDVTLQCLLHDELACANRSWGSSLKPGLDTFPFSAEEQVKITFRHIVGAIEVIFIYYKK